MTKRGEQWTFAFRWLVSLLASGLSDAAKILGVDGFAVMDKNTGRFFRSIDDQMAATNKSRGAVVARRRELVSAGWWVQEKRGGGGRATEYRGVIPATKEADERASIEADGLAPLPESKRPTNEPHSTGKRTESGPKEADEQAPRGTRDKKNPDRALPQEFNSRYVAIRGGQVCRLLDWAPEPSPDASKSEREAYEVWRLAKADRDSRNRPPEPEEEREGFVDRRVLDCLEGAPGDDVRSLGDRLARDGQGMPLKRETILKSLGRLVTRGSADGDEGRWWKTDDLAGVLDQVEGRSRVDRTEELIDRSIRAVVESVAQGNFDRAEDATVILFALKSTEEAPA